jgi:glutamate 5-kinase
MKGRIGEASRIVIKIGSALLVEAASGQLKSAWLDSLVADIAELKARGADVIAVSSGAIALGRRKLGFPSGPLRLDQSQAAAAVGQIALADAWSAALGRKGLMAAQILLTLTDTEERRRYLNARSTITTLLAQGAVPVINENDTVATSEIRYGDNDRLAARVTSMMTGDCLVLLSDIDGLYTAPPGTSGAERLAQVTEITPAIEAMAGKPVSGLGSGGMITKIEAAKIALGAGADMVIASGHIMNPLHAIADEDRCTWFLAQGNAATARKRWIAGSLIPGGRITVDAGAAGALQKGASLLPAGVRGVEGEFSRGDTVSVINDRGAEIARGLIAYDAGDARMIAGKRSTDIEQALGFRGRDEMIHRDDLVLLGPAA